MGQARNFWTMSYSLTSGGKGRREKSDVTLQMADKMQRPFVHLAVQFGDLTHFISPKGIFVEIRRARFVNTCPKQ